MSWVIVRCPAKINLTFTIYGKCERKSDPYHGYHYIESVVQTIDIYDHLTLTKRDQGLMITGSMPARVPFGSLIGKAVFALERAIGKELPCEIHLDKQIPIGAGLGGGSSNAAGVLGGLTQLYDLSIGDSELMEIGATLGADVPLFFRGHTCIISGIGEKVEHVSEEISSTDTMFFIFRPHKRLSSREAYEEYDKTGYSFDDQAHRKVHQLQTIFEMFPGAKISGKGPSCFIIRNEKTYDETMELVNPLIETWDGDIFVARPCGPYEILE